MLARFATAAAAIALLFLTVAGVHGQEAAFDQTETCEGKAEGAECWKQLSSHPGCYVWDNGLKAEQTVSWTGACNGSVADGEGVLTWADPEDASVYEGVLIGGKLHGRVSATQGNGTVSEGNYAAGQRVGRWRHVWADGTVVEGIMANGRVTGRWVWRYADDPAGDPADHGYVRESPYVNGEIHGTVVERFANGTVHETPYVNGEMHGTKVSRFADGTVRETPYVNDEMHGTMVQRDADGDVTETPYVRGDKHGTEVTRDADGDVTTETPWVNGEMHGTRVQRHGGEESDANPAWIVFETPFVNGEIHGTMVVRSWHSVTETPFVNGRPHGTEVERFRDGTVTETPWVNGKKHGTAVRRDADGNVTDEYRYVNGEEQPELSLGLAGETASSLTGNAPMSGGTAPCEIPGLTDGTLDVQSLDTDTLGLPWCPASVSIQRRAFALQAEAIRCRLATDPPVPNAAEAREALKQTCERLAALSDRGNVSSGFSRDLAGGVSVGSGGSCQCPAGFYQ